MSEELNWDDISHFREATGSSVAKFIATRVSGILSFCIPSLKILIARFKLPSFFLPPIFHKPKLHKIVGNQVYLLDVLF